MKNRNIWAHKIAPFLVKNWKYTNVHTRYSHMHDICVNFTHLELKLLIYLKPTFVINVQTKLDNQFGATKVKQNTHIKSHRLRWTRFFSVCIVCGGMSHSHLNTGFLYFPSLYAPKQFDKPMTHTQARFHWDISLFI